MATIAAPQADIQRSDPRSGARLWHWSTVGINSDDVSNVITFPFPPNFSLIQVVNCFFRILNQATVVILDGEAAQLRYLRDNQAMWITIGEWFEIESSRWAVVLKDELPKFPLNSDWSLQIFTGQLDSNVSGTVDMDLDLTVFAK